MLLSNLKKMIRQYDMMHVLTLIQPDKTATDGRILSETFKLIDQYSEHEITTDLVHSSVEQF